MVRGRDRRAGGDRRCKLDGTAALAERHWPVCDFAHSNPLASWTSTRIAVRRSGQQFFDHVTMHIGQPPFDAVVIEGEPLVVETEQV